MPETISMDVAAASMLQGESKLGRSHHDISNSLGQSLLYLIMSSFRLDGALFGIFKLSIEEGR